MRFTRVSCQEAFDASNTTLTLLGLDQQLPRCVFCSLADVLEAFGQLVQLGAIVHEDVRDVAALLAVRQLAGNATRSVAVERSAHELLVRVETLPLPPHVARA